MLVTWWLLPSVLVLPPSLAVTLTYLPISPSPAMRKGAESTLWERIENTMKWKELENYKLETLLLSQYRFLVLSPHLNHFRPVEANANKFPDINKSRNRIPSFFYQILPGNDGGNPCEDDRSDTSVSDPWERCLDSGLKLGVGRESRGELLLLSTCLSLTQPFQPHLFLSFTTCRNQILLELQMIPNNV